MSKDSEECPTPDRLADLLESQDASDLALEDHIESCEACRLHLEQLAGNAGWKQLLSDSMASFSNGPISPFAHARTEPADDTAAVDQTATTPDSSTANRRSFPTVEGFTIKEQIGSGGMGTVYRAYQHGAGRDVALKVLSRDPLSPERRLRLRTEAEAVGRLNHAHIVQLFQSGDADGTAFVVHELLGGGSLQNRMDGRPFAPSEAAAIIEKLASATQHAHQHGVLHRDIKPGNILFEDDMSSTVKLSDFGLAQLSDTDRSLTVTGEVIGTPAYMSPEQATGNSRQLTVTADVFSLGVVLYELLTGVSPFRAETPLESIRLIADHDPVAPNRLQPGIPRDLVTICLQCLQKAPEKRYDSAEALRVDLERFREGRPILAQPPGLIDRAWKVARRRPLVTLLSSMSVLAVLVIAIGGTILTSQLSTANTDLGAANEMLKERNDELNVQTQIANDKTRVAQRESKAARRQQNIATAYNTFLLNDLLQQSTVEGQLDWVRANNLRSAEPLRDPSLGQLLDRAEHALAPDLIEKRFPGEPLVQAQVLHTAGRIRLRLGEFEKARDLLQRAYDRMQSSSSSSENSTTDCATDLARAMMATAPIQQAIEFLTSAVEEAESINGFESLSVLQLKVLLAEAQGMLGGKDLRELTGGCFEGLKAVAGDDHPMTLKAGILHVISLRVAGEYQPALELSRSLTADSIELLGEEHPDTLQAIYEESSCLSAIGNVDESTRLRTGIVQTAETALGKDHPATHFYRNARVVDYALRTPEERAEVAEQRLHSLRVITAAYHDRHPFVSDTRTKAADALAREKRFDEAIPIQQKAAETAREQFGETHEIVMAADSYLARLYGMAGNDEQAIASLQQLERRSTENSQRGSGVTFGIRHMLAEAQLRNGQPEESLATAERNYSESLEVRGSQHLNTYTSGYAIIAACRNLKNNNRLAEITASMINAATENPRMAGNTSMIMMLRRLQATAHFELKEWGEAERFLAPLVDTILKSEQLVMSDYVLQIQLGVSLLRTGKRERAADQLRAAIKGIESLPEDTPGRDNNLKLANNVLKEATDEDTGVHAEDEPSE